VVNGLKQSVHSFKNKLDHVYNRAFYVYKACVFLSDLNKSRQHGVVVGSVCNSFCQCLVVVITVTRYGKVISTKAIMDPAVNKCKGI